LLRYAVWSVGDADETTEEFEPKYISQPLTLDSGTGNSSSAKCTAPECVPDQS
jgi:hypothetical protein